MQEDLTRKQKYTTTCQEDFLVPDALRHTEHKKILYQETISSGAELLIDVLVLKMTVNDGFELAS